MKKILYLIIVALLAAAVPTWGQTNRTLGDIPTGWKVQAGNVDFTATEAKHEVQIPAGANVTLTPLNPDRVKSVTLVDAPACRLIRLDTLHHDFVAQDCDTLTGTLNGSTQKYKIAIADGATVTLKNVTINGWSDNVETASQSTVAWAGLTCEGDATIILKDGSTNSVKGFHKYYPGIYVPVDKTLTIKGETAGTGSLNASSQSNGRGAGIGGGYDGINCGNIDIQGGNITAIGGYYAASIGSGGAPAGSSYGSRCGNISISGGTVIANGESIAGIFTAAGIGCGEYGYCGNISIAGGNVTASGGENSAGIGSGNGHYYYINHHYHLSVCGNILISGGTVTANGGKSSAGIGCGESANCGTITITDGVTQVTAKDGGENAPNSIGAGYGESTCGTVTIGGTVYYQDNAYVGTGSTYLTQSPLDYPSLLLRGKFTINGNGGKVQFSKGNLKRVNDTWSFFTNQYDCLGDTWNSTSCDLFYWEMTGNYGSAQSCVTSSGTASDVVDWGTNIGTGWKTLTKDEWVYLFNTRTNASSKYGYGIVNEVKGMIILPDSWTLPDGLSFTAGISYFTNNYSTAQWSQMEAAGAVFLPAAGNRDSGGPNNRNIDGYYMSSSPDGVDKAYRVQFYSNYLKVDYSFQRSQGGAVRLVKDAN